MTFGYANGRTPNTEKANEAVRKYGQPKRKGKPATWVGSENEAEVRKKISESKRGKRIPSLQGKNHWNWRGGVDKGIWHTYEYRVWRRSVFERDGFKCVHCGDNKGGNLEADHIKPKYLFPELVFDLDNGRTLCHNCHVKTPTYGHKVKLLKYAEEVN